MAYDWAWNNLGTAQGQAGAAGGALGIAGSITSMIGAQQSASAAGDIAKDSGNIAGLEMQVNAQRQLQMHLQVQRAQMQNLRNTQRARAAGLVAATSSGAAVGGPGGAMSSAFGGAQANAGVEGARNDLAQTQNLQIGDTIFGLDSQIDQQKINIAQAQSKMYSGQGLSSLGGAISSASSILGKFMVPMG